MYFGSWSLLFGSRVSCLLFSLRLELRFLCQHRQMAADGNSEQRVFLRAASPWYSWDKYSRTGKANEETVFDVISDFSLSYRAI